MADDDEEDDREDIPRRRRHRRWYKMESSDAIATGFVFLVVLVAKAVAGLFRLGMKHSSLARRRFSQR